MATASQIEALRADVGASEASLSDVQATAALDDAILRCGDTRAAVAYSRVIVLRRLMASSAFLTSYRQNETTENLSDVSKNLGDLLKVWERAVADALADEAALASSPVNRVSVRVPTKAVW